MAKGGRWLMHQTRQEQEVVVLVVEEEVVVKERDQEGRNH
jgi:hypothetical protein